MTNNGIISLIYIIGRGHSGSTLLDLVLGEHSNITGLGELRWLSNRKRARSNFLDNECTCGAPRTANCSFWISIETILGDKFGLSLKTLDLEADDDQTFIFHNMALLSAVRAVTGSKYLVDSSKSPHRLKRLNTLCNSLDIRPVYIVRNPCGVTYSHLKRGRDLKLWAKKYAAYTDEIHRALIGLNFHLVEYERFCRTPTEVLDSVMFYLGLQTEDEQLAVDHRLHHNLAGNSLRFNKSLEIAIDEAWRKNLTLMEKLIVFRYTHSQRLAISRLRSELR